MDLSSSIPMVIAGKWSNAGITVSLTPIHLGDIEDTTCRGWVIADSGNVCNVSPFRDALSVGFEDGDGTYPGNGSDERGIGGPIEGVIPIVGVTTYPVVQIWPLEDPPPAAVSSLRRVQELALTHCDFLTLRAFWSPPVLVAAIIVTLGCSCENCWPTLGGRRTGQFIANAFGSIKLET